jgi:DNA polymerase-3 subunit alpha
MLAYRTAYMKANFPVIYVASVLTAESGDIDKISEIINETRRMSIPVLPPSVNQSFGDFTVVKNEKTEKSNAEEAIRFGLHSIKNLGEGIADVVIEERKKSGAYKSLTDFLSRITDKNLNKKSLESLIKCGALDDFGERGKMLGNLEALLSFNKEQKTRGDNQDSLFSADILPELFLEEKPQANEKEKLAWEKELMGLYISGHPLDAFREKFEKRGTDIAKIKAESPEGAETVIAGIVSEYKEILTKKGDKMAFVTLADMSDSIETVVFPRVLVEFSSILLPEACIAMKGKISKRNGGISLIADKVKKL